MTDCGIEVDILENELNVTVDDNNISAQFVENLIEVDILDNEIFLKIEENNIAVNQLEEIIEVNIIDNEIYVETDDNSIAAQFVSNDVDIGIIENEVNVDIVNNEINATICNSVGIPLPGQEQRSDYVEDTFTSYEGIAVDGSDEDEPVWEITIDITTLSGTVTSSTIHQNVKRTDRYAL